MPPPLSIDQELLEHLGQLARIALPADRQKALRQQLQQLVHAFSALGDVELEEDGRSEANNCIGVDQLREDLGDAPRSPTEVLANAPQTAADSFVVARVMEP
jgi:aspartyl/glutamyl-tRNA(Asn/Gln) amidotransferase C subunit